MILAHGAGAGGTDLLSAAALAVAVPVFVVWRLLDRRPGPSRGWVSVAAWSSLLAGIVHLVVVPEHWSESSMYGSFFVVTVISQVGAAVLLARHPASWLCLLTVAGQLAITVLWVVTRTLGIPLGPEAGEVEPVGVLDSICVAAQLVSAAACVVLVRRVPRREQEGRAAAVA